MKKKLKKLHGLVIKYIVHTIVRLVWDLGLNTSEKFHYISQENGTGGIG